MCGISGILNFSSEATVDHRMLDRMRDVMRHRGPDDAGSMVEGQIGLSHRRLSIIDLKGGHQPMSNAAGSIWLTYNGEIYNYRELRSVLRRMGYVFGTASDTEVILHAYEAFGDACVDYLRGMFAFAIWDANRRKLLLARDRLGIKPLYYHVGEKRLMFASEIKGILASGEVNPGFNSNVLPEFLATRYVSGEATFFTGIKKLLPGRIMTWTSTEGLKESRYWQLSGAEVAGGNFASHADDIREALTDAVDSHLVSDVPVGLFLSGGIDSSALAAIMSSRNKIPIKTFSVAFSERSANELDYARLAARAAGADHHDVVVSPREFFDQLPALVWHEDEPIAFSSSVPLHVVSKLAARHVKVVLTGEGADELLLGYNKYRVTAWNYRLGAVYGRLLPEPLRRGIAVQVPRLPGKLGRYGSRTFLARDAGERNLYCENFSVFSHSLQQQLLADESLAAIDPHAETLRYWRLAQRGPLGRMGFVDMHTHLVELLMKQDQMSMSVSLESRVPFLDHKFVELAMSLPDHHKVRGWRTKAVLRKALEGIVPKPILTRRKMGFPVPLGPWLRRDFRPLMEDLVLSSRSLERDLFQQQFVKTMVEEHVSGSVNHGERLWLLMNLEIWQRIFLDGESLSQTWDVAHVAGSSVRKMAAAR